jgi:hypothetical protein
MASLAGRTDFVGMVAQEISSGIDRALQYWLGRIEVEVMDRSLSSAQRINAIEDILQEYKGVTSGEYFGRASA